MILSWIISQVLMILYIRMAAWHHAPAVNAMREYAPTPNPYEDPFHFWSFGQAVIVALCISLGLLSYQPWYWCAVMGLLCGCWYSLLFDPWISKGIHMNWDYLGNDPGIDRWLKRLFGKNAGQIKATILSAIIIVINVLRFIL